MASKYSKLQQDPEFFELQQTGIEVVEQIHQVLGSREVTIKLLEELKKEVEESYNKSRKARIAGTAASVVGSTISIVGFGLGFVTFGAGFGLAVAGGILAGAGGITTAGSEIGYYAVSKIKLSDAKKACEEDREMMIKVVSLAEKFESNLESLKTKHRMTAREILNEIMNVKKVIAFGYRAYKTLDSVFEACKTVYSIIKAGAPAARTAWQAASTIARVVSVVGVVFDVAFIPIDLAVMVKSAYDVHKFKKKGESNSNVAKEIQGLIDKLKKNKEEITKIL